MILSGKKLNRVKLDWFLKQFKQFKQFIAFKTILSLKFQICWLSSLKVNYTYIQDTNSTHFYIFASRDGENSITRNQVSHVKKNTSHHATGDLTSTAGP